MWPQSVSRRIARRMQRLRPITGALRRLSAAVGMQGVIAEADAADRTVAE